MLSSNGFEIFDIVYILKMAVNILMLFMKVILILNIFATRKNIKPTKRLVNKKLLML
jgi:hypothetical protein